MDNLIQTLEQIPDLLYQEGCSLRQIRDGQASLNIEFPREYSAYLRNFGAIAFGSVEWTGLNIQGHLNVVTATLQEAEQNPIFPADCFLLEHLGIDGLLTIVSQEGQVFALQSDRKEPICDTIAEYLALRLQDQKLAPT